MLSLLFSAIEKSTDEEIIQQRFIMTRPDYIDELDAWHIINVDKHHFVRPDSRLMLTVFREVAAEEDFQDQVSYLPLSFSLRQNSTLTSHLFCNRSITLCLESTSSSLSIVLGKSSLFEQNERFDIWLTFSIVSQRTYGQDRRG